MDDHEKRRRRAEERHRWPVRTFALGEEPSEDLSATTTVEERLAMMWPLARDAWLLSGRSLPTYERHEAPGKLIQRTLVDP